MNWTLGIFGITTLKKQQHWCTANEFDNILNYDKGVVGVSVCAKQMHNINSTVFRGKGNIYFFFMS